MKLPYSTPAIFSLRPAVLRGDLAAVAGAAYAIRYHHKKIMSK